MIKASSSMQGILKVFFGVLLTLHCFVWGATVARATQYQVLIVTWRGCEDACRGFQDYLNDAGLDVDFVLRDANRDKNVLSKFLEEARERRFDLILTWGTSVTRGIAGTLDNLDNPGFNHDIPQVFTIVSDPVGADIVVALEDTGRANLTGTYNRVPELVNIETLRSYSREFERLGIIYHKDEENSVRKFNELSELSESMGFGLSAVELALAADGKPSPEDIEPAIRELQAAGVDFIYMGSSSFLLSNRDTLADVARKYGLPVLSPYEQLVRDAQALISVAARYYEVGRLAGMQAEKILADNSIPGDLPVAQMTNFAIVINMKVAKSLGLFPPIDLLQVAEIVE